MNSLKAIGAHVVALLIIAAILVPLIFVYLANFDESLPPVKRWNDDMVTPREVHAGDTITIYRSFTVTRATTLKVSRVMVKGDCRKACDLRDMPSSIMEIEPGDYVRARRDHIVPLTTQPGVWKLKFYIHWHNRLGQTKTMPLPELEIEVVK